MAVSSQKYPHFCWIQNILDYRETDISRWTSYDAFSNSLLKYKHPFVNSSVIHASSSSSSFSLYSLGLFMSSMGRWLRDPGGVWNGLSFFCFSAAEGSLLFSIWSVISEELWGERFSLEEYSSWSEDSRANSIRERWGNSSKGVATIEEFSLIASPGGGELRREVDGGVQPTASYQTQSRRTRTHGHNRRKSNWFWCTQKVQINMTTSTTNSFK